MLILQLVTEHSLWLSWVLTACDFLDFSGSETRHQPIVTPMTCLEKGHIEINKID